MGLPPRGPSAGKRGTLRELQRRRSNPLAPKRPPAKKPSSPPLPPCEGAPDKVRKASTSGESSSVTAMDRSGSASIHASPPLRPLPQAPPRATLATTPQQPPSRSVGSLIGSASASASIRGAAAHLKPGTAVRVRTRTMVRLAKKTLEGWFWLPATVVSAADDGSYEVVYKGKIPRHDPFATVVVANDHVVPEKQTLSSSRAATSSDSATGTLAAASEISDVQSTARPSTSVRLVNNHVSEMQMQPLHRTASTSASARPELTNAVPKTQKLQSAPRPTTAGKSLRLISSIWPEMELPPRMT